MGGVAGLVFREDTLELAPGDLLLLHTDGVTEVSRRDLDFGERDLRETLRTHAGASAEAIVAAVEARAVALQDGEPRDDIAVIAIRALGDPSA